MKTRLREAWEDAGWAAAVAITDKPCSWLLAEEQGLSARSQEQETTSAASRVWEPEEDIDSIPF